MSEAGERRVKWMRAIAREYTPGLHAVVAEVWGSAYTATSDGSIHSGRVGILYLVDCDFPDRNGLFLLI
jgi:hypothetical protein